MEHLSAKESLNGTAKSRAAPLAPLQSFLGDFSLDFFCLTDYSPFTHLKQFFCVHSSF